MNRNVKFSSKEIGGVGYQVFKENPIKIKKKKVDIELHYIVPWELTQGGVQEIFLLNPDHFIKSLVSNGLSTNSTFNPSVIKPSDPIFKWYEYESE